MSSEKRFTLVQVSCALKNKLHKVYVVADEGTRIDEIRKTGGVALRRAMPASITAVHDIIPKFEILGDALLMESDNDK